MLKSLALTTQVKSKSDERVQPDWPNCCFSVLKSLALTILLPPVVGLLSPPRCVPASKLLWLHELTVSTPQLARCLGPFTRQLAPPVGKPLPRGTVKKPLASAVTEASTSV